MNAKLIKPTLARVLVEKTVKEETTDSGLILSSGLKVSEKGQLVKVEVEDTDLTYQGVILAVGPDVKHAKKGEKVLVSKYSGLEIQKETNVFLISETDILATF